MRETASSAFDCVLAGSINSAPFRASSSAASNPMPLLAPVITTLRPACEAMFSLVHFVFIGLVSDQEYKLELGLWFVRIVSYR
jgi:hypothetical protein